MQEKRRLERFELKVSARIEGIGEKRNKNVLRLRTSDISAGGAFFYTDRCLPEGTDVKIDLVLPLKRLKRLAAEYDHAHISLTGRVVRRESRGMAVRFNEDYTIRPRKGKSPSGASRNEKQGARSGALLRSAARGRAATRERSS